MKSLVKKAGKKDKQTKTKQAQCCAKTTVAVAGCHD